MRHSVESTKVSYHSSSHMLIDFIKSYLGTSDYCSVVEYLPSMWRPWVQSPAPLPTPTKKRVIGSLSLQRKQLTTSFLFFPFNPMMKFELSSKNWDLGKCEPTTVSLITSQSLFFMTVQAMLMNVIFRYNEMCHRLKISTIQRTDVRCYKIRYR